MSPFLLSCSTCVKGWPISIWISTQLFTSRSYYIRSFGLPHWVSLIYLNVFELLLPLSFSLLPLSLHPLLFFHLPLFLFLLLSLVFFFERLAFSSKLMTVPVLLTNIPLACVTFLSLASTHVNVILEVLEWYHLLTVTTGLWFHLTALLVVTKNRLCSFVRTVLASHIHMGFLFVLLSFCLSHYFPTLLTLVIVASAAHFVHSELAGRYLSLTSTTLLSFLGLVLEVRHQKQFKLEI